MPLFNRHNTPPPPAETTTPTRKSSLFSRHHSPPPSTTTVNSRHSTASHSSTSPKRHNLLHRNDEDASIIAARERVTNAEAAEREADKALVVARRAVKEAREHILRLEKEAEREAKLAHIKQEKARGLTKRGHGLGRHDQVN